MDDDTWYAIDFGPKGYPDRWVVCKKETHYSVSSTREQFVLEKGSILEDARAAIPPGLSCWPCNPNVSSTVEIWR